MTVLAYVIVVGLAMVAAVESTRFSLRYSRTTWRRTAMGKHLMGLSRALAVALWLTLLAAVWAMPFWLAFATQTLVFGWLAFEANRRNRLLTLHQREARDSSKA